MDRIFHPHNSMQSSSIVHIMLAPLLLLYARLSITMCSAFASHRIIINTAYLKRINNSKNENISYQLKHMQMHGRNKRQVKKWKHHDFQWYCMHKYGRLKSEKKTKKISIKYKRWSGREKDILFFQQFAAFFISIQMHRAVHSSIQQQLNTLKEFIWFIMYTHNALIRWKCWAREIKMEKNSRAKHWKDMNS